MTEHLPTSTLVERTATELIHRSSQEEVEAVLRQQGTSDEDALKLVLLVPSAFAREYYEPTGISFPDHFLVGLPGEYREREYSREPYYGEARKLAREWLKQQRGLLVLRVLEWSSEANAIKEATAKGLTGLSMSAVHHGFGK